jgi:hypothetical protein
MDILTNARDSIVMGLEDYSSSNPKRLISCTRNLFAGILLLFKYKLSLLSPANSDEALIKQKVLPRIDSSGSVVWIGQGKNTVDVQQIKERFISLRIRVDWDRVEEIRKFRNDIEHYQSELPKAAMHKLISDSFLIIRNFLSQHLDLDPKKFLGKKAWNTLISVSEVYQKEKEECVKVIDTIEWGSEALYSALISYECSNCGSGLISIRKPKKKRDDNVFHCRSCRTSWDFETIAEAAIKDYFEWDEYLHYSEGGELPIITCPECLHDTYIIDEQSCVLCGASAEHECARCGNEIPPEEIDGSGYCSWCAHMMSRDD